MFLKLIWGLHEASGWNGGFQQDAEINGGGSGQTILPLPVQQLLNLWFTMRTMSVTLVMALVT